MILDELIEELTILREKYGGNIEVRKLKHLDYLAPIFKGYVTYNQQINIIEL